ncbi:hypothetical protein BLX88_05385 [Bacillus obstructivus]|nr:hypothetical protein BLX88_05385 [Bacillus obstructivus]
MDQRKLHVWQPVNNLEKGNITEANFNFSDEKGLCIRLIDIKGISVDIIYDKISNIQDYVWSFRYAGEIPRSDLTPAVKEAYKRASNIDKTAACFYKMTNSDFIEWFDQLQWLGSNDIPNVEHHVYIYNNGVFEVISDYEPKLIIKNMV